MAEILDLENKLIEKLRTSTASNARELLAKHPLLNEEFNSFSAYRDELVLLTVGGVIKKELEEIMELDGVTEVNDEICETFRFALCHHNLHAALTFYLAGVERLGGDINKLVASLEDLKTVLLS